MDKVIDSTHGRFFIREYCNDDEQNVLELWEAAFGKKLSLDIWRWKFCRNPFGRQIMLCVNEQSKPVAMYSGIPYSANWKGKQVTFTQLIDNMSHPEYRFTVSGKKGLYALTVEKFGHSEGSIMSYGFSGEKHFRLGKLQLNYQIMGGGGVYLKTKLDYLKSKRNYTLQKNETTNNTNNFFDELQKKLSTKYPFAVLRNDQFIQWRFLDVNQKKYIIYTAKNWLNKPLAYIVISIKDSTATIVDIFGTDSEYEIERLISAVADDLKHKYLKDIQTWLPANHFLVNKLLSVGFRSCIEPLGIIPGVAIYNPLLSFDYVNNCIFYTMADADLF